MRLVSIRPMICPMATNSRIGNTHVVRKLSSGESCVGIAEANSAPDA